jgi:hypothetical protein
VGVDHEGRVRTKSDRISWDVSATDGMGTASVRSLDGLTRLLPEAANCLRHESVGTTR